MSEVAWRLIAVGGVAALALAAGWVARRLTVRRTSARLLDVGGIEGRILLFTQASCRSCDVARARLEAAGIEYVEIAYEASPEVHRKAGVTAVPVLVVRNDAGDVSAQIAGKPRRRSLRGLDRSAGVK